MQKADTLIRTKLRLPFTPPELVPRPRLQARITEGLCWSLFPSYSSSVWVTRVLQGQELMFHSFGCIISHGWTHSCQGSW